MTEYIETPSMRIPAERAFLTDFIARATAALTDPNWCPLPSGAYGDELRRAIALCEALLEEITEETR